MNPQDLMKPRYKVIADYPNSRYKVGEVLKYPTLGGHTMDDFFEKVCSRYPHLFKPLQWWEEIKAEDMPEYVKNSRNEIVRVIELETNGLFYEYPKGMEGKMWIRYSSCTPSTESEYLEAIKQIK